MYSKSTEPRDMKCNYITDFFEILKLILAHLWGAYAIPMALSIVRRVSSVSKVIKSIFGAIVHHVPGLCLLGIGGAPYISHKIMAQKPNFYIFDFFSDNTRRWCFILSWKIP